ncbi:MAG: hypothetical protein ACPGED_10350 [Flavobacteriales bacterium]
MDSTFYNILKHAHSGLRWVLLIVLILGIVRFFSKKANGTFESGDKKLALFGLIFCHIQLLIGLAIYLLGDFPGLLGELGMGSKFARFFGMEHVLMMVIGIVIITFGYSSSKRMSDSKKKFSRLAWTYLIGLLLILSRIPWPFFDGLNGGWF